ncbi:oligopeptide/dipeptide ABC transporter ATP-binding protein [Actinoplanes campanulatus]|uniref:Oligopeptide/dipeptide ABC transporter ATP-binding protein n=1 Tax=Actinoplanes campanulatus TaxID=113559 RepID=A0A7W5AB62_9ACTN|nr:dipeptide ABC transporter ATP-binding protein [Actinoplanes campanulatus]MBB3092765.1 oligopeptide/dipeptide ABC transporter ATP-binding protein [Actinoplanes campanulatus]GGM98861.1 dipeptide/oligopeptide/nickel ABC transporter ATP-binding protein [Actinoplanes campanulatus]GID34138.1 dipeptide/oligopeptide/nickel ABC transporter ATP-binding protein [Actinoplanes campanulatus]
MTDATAAKSGVRKVEGAPLLELDDVKMHFRIKGDGILALGNKWVQAVDGVSLTLQPGETLGLVGESGCGKSTTARLITRLLEPTGGQIRFQGVDIAHMNERQLRPYRREIQLIFQDPYSSLNPRHTVGTIVGTALRTHDMVPKSGELKRVQELLEMVGLNPEHYNRYPHEFSGGQRQRIGIARALAARPKVIVADEPVSALDVSIQAQVMNLLENLRKELGIAFVFIAHDLGVVRHFCDRVAVMYLGRVVEEGPRDELYEKPNHPYTQALLSAVPDIGVVRGVPPKNRIRLVGDVPSPVDPPSGCRFRTRCWKAEEICATQDPALLEHTEKLHTACHFAAPPTESIVAETV